MKHILFSLFVSLLVAGCGLPSVREARYKEECQTEFGLQPGSEAFMNCVMAKHQLHAAALANSAHWGSGGFTYYNSNW